MTNIDYIRPMEKTRRILLLIYDGFELLDMSGPASVFTAANNMAGKRVYDVKTVSAKGGEILSNAGLCVMSETLATLTPRKTDTILVVGAESDAIAAAMADTAITGWLTEVTKIVERYGSVCSGAFIMATTGLLDYRRVTTHWAGCRRLAEAFPSMSVEPNAIYIVDDRLWTSAGVTTGIDMTLAMVEQDVGSQLMRQVAKWLVVYAHRPGTQLQYSNLLAAQSVADGAFGDVVGWMSDHLDQSIRLEDMASRARYV